MLAQIIGALLGGTLSGTGIDAIVGQILGGLISSGGFGSS